MKNGVMLVSQGRKKHMARPGLEPRTSRISCEHSDHWATEPQGRPVTIFPCLIRVVPESVRNHARNDETVPLLLAAQPRTQTEPPNVTGEEKAHDPTGTRTQDLSHTVQALWPLSYRATRSACDPGLANLATLLRKKPFPQHLHIAHVHWLTKETLHTFFTNGSNRNVEIWYLLCSNRCIIATMLFDSSIIVVFDWRFMRWRPLL